MDKETQAKFDELEKKVDDQQEVIDTLLDEFENHHHTGLDSQQIDGTSLKETPFAKIQNPTSAGATYNQSQITSIVSSVNVIIEYLEDLHITSDQ